MLELETVPGGTSRSGHSSLTAYPWGAHYVPVPMAENRSLIAILREMGVIERLDADGDADRRANNISAAIRASECSATEPGKRESILRRARPRSDLDELQRLPRGNRTLGRVARRQGPPGVRHSGGDRFRRSRSDGPRLDLDVRVDPAPRLDLAATALAGRLFVPGRLRRDERQTSAWAGLFYFASRVGGADGESQPLITWPEGNGRIVQHLADKVRRATPLRPRGRRRRAEKGSRHRGVEIAAVDVQTGEAVGFRAQRAVFAAPQFLAPYLIRDLPEDRKRSCPRVPIQSLAGRQSASARAAAPNGLSLVLGQRRLRQPITGLRDGHAPNGHRLRSDRADVVRRAVRRRLCRSVPNSFGGPAATFDLTWAEAAEIVLSDLEPAHPEIRSLVERLDVMKWGHAMVRPRTGFVFSPARQTAATRLRPDPFRGHRPERRRAL